LKTEQDMMAEALQLQKVLSILGKYTARQARADMCFDLFFTAAVPFLVPLMLKAITPKRQALVCSMMYDELVVIANKYVDPDLVAAEKSKQAEEKG
jgi:hypothetical protein